MKDETNFKPLIGRVIHIDDAKQNCMVLGEDALLFMKQMNMKFYLKIDTNYSNLQKKINQNFMGRH